MTERFRLTLGQMAPTAGELSGNAALALTAWRAGKAAGAQLVALPELFLAGTHSVSLLAKAAFLRDLRLHLDQLARDCAPGPALAIGAPWQEGGQTYNAYVVLEGGKVTQRVLKHALTPEETTGPLAAAPISGPMVIAGLRIGFPIGFEATQPDVAETLAETGAELLLVPDAAPYVQGGADRRLNHMVARVVETGLPLIHLNRTGAEGEAVFDGASLALNRGGALATRLPVFDAEISHVDLERGAEGWRIALGPVAQQPEAEEQDYRALVESLRHHVAGREKKSALVDLSGGGAAASLVAVLATDALGPAATRGVVMPGQAPDDDAAALARHLGIAAQVVPLTQMRAALSATLAPLAPAEMPGQTDAALRGFMMTQLAARLDACVLSTEIKPEHLLASNQSLADIAPLADLYPSRIAALVQWRNAQHRPWMKGPEGALLPNVLAEDEAPTEQEALLRILVDQNGSLADCRAAGHDPEHAAKLAAQLQQNLAAQRPLVPRMAPAPGCAARAAESFWQDPG